VAEIRSSTSGIVHHTTDTEKLCERISSAMERWEAVCKGSEAALPMVADWLLTSDKFCACIDNVLVRMDNVRDDLNQSLADMQTNPHQLNVSSNSSSSRLLVVPSTRSGSSSSSNVK